MTDQSQAVFFAPPDPSLPGAVLSMITRDIYAVSQRLRTSVSVVEAFGYRDSIRMTTDEICESMIAAASTASLIGYLRSDDDWRLDVCSESSDAGASIIAALDDLRADISASEKGIRRYCLMTRAHVNAKRCAAILALALDAASHVNLPDFQMIAGVSRSSQDVQGDAQEYAERLDLDAALPLKR